MYQMTKKIPMIAVAGVATLCGFTQISSANNTNQQKQQDVKNNTPAVTAPVATKPDKVEKAVNKDIPEVTGNVQHIIVSGSTATPHEKILEQVTHIKVGQPYDREAVKADLKAITDSGLVQKASAKALQNNGELYVVFEVAEVANVKSVAFEGNTLIPTDQLMQALVTKQGEKFSKDAVRQDIENIRAMYQKAGYVAIIKDVNNNDGNITYHVSEAKIGKVTFSGNAKTKQWVLEKVGGKYLQPGQYLTQDALKAAYNQLAATGFFSDVKINANESQDQPGTIDLDVAVKEQSTGAWNIGGAYSDTYKAEVIGGIYDKNLGGTAKSLALDFGVGQERDHYTLTYTDPYWKHSDTSVYVQAFKTNKDVDNDFYEYSEAHTGGEIGFSKPIANNGRTTLYGNFRSDDVDVSDQEKGPEMGSVKENSVTLGVINDNRNASTGSGTVLEGSVTSAQEFLGSDDSFTKFLLRSKHYKRLSNRDMLAARTEFNFSPDSLPGVEQFSIGGSDSIRGMEEDEQRGDKSILGSVELRHDFTDKLQGVVFVDAGKAWSDEIDNDLKIATGLGVRIKTALGVLRLDAAKTNGNDTKFLFGIGQSF